MISVFIFWLYTILLAALYGWFVVGLVRRVLHLEDEPIGFTLTWLAGLSALVTAASFFSLLSKTGLLVHLLLLAGALLILLRGLITGKLQNVVRQWLSDLPFSSERKGWPEVVAAVLTIVVVATVLYLSCGSPANPDSGIYHAQAIRWIENYRAVPGLGNIHTRLAYNSAWMVANALFSFSYLGLRSFHLIGSSLYLVAALYSLGGLFRILKHGQEEIRPSSIGRFMLLPFLFIVLGSEASSPGSDMPAALFAWIVFLELLEYYENRDGNSGLLRLTLLALCAVFTVTIKLSHAPLLFVTLPLLWHFIKERNAGRVITLALLGIVVVLPWLARNVVLSGYAVYPYPALDVFDVDWKIPPEIARQDQDTILSWTKPWLEGQDVQDVLQMPLRQWAPIWFDRLTMNRKFMAAGMALLPLVLLMSFLFKKSACIQTYLRRNWFVYVFLYACLAFWFFNGPAFRFGYGFIIPALVLGMVPFCLPFLNWLQTHSRTVALLAAFMLLAFQGLFFVKIFDADVVGQDWLLPADYPDLPTYPCELSNITIWCAEYWEACWYDDFPCVPNADAHVGMRCESLQEGFSYRR